VAYRRAKSVKAMKKGGGAGGMKKSIKKSSRREEMHELFQGDMSESKQAQGFRKGTGNSLKNKQTSFFKSKSRYVVFFVFCPWVFDLPFTKLLSSDVFVI
jgi:hypothetical protein